MHTNHKTKCQPFISDNGETVYELIGHVATPGDIKHSLAYIEILPGKASLKHFHPVAEESYYILQGQARMVIENETQTLTPGMSVLIPPKKVHQIFNDGKELLHFMAVCIPAWTPECSVFVD